LVFCIAILPRRAAGISRLRESRTLAATIERGWRAAASIAMLFSPLGRSRDAPVSPTPTGDETMHLLAHVTEVELSTMVVVFALGLLCGLAGGCGLGWFIGNRRK
jgi:hypothetical protein